MKDLMLFLYCAMAVKMDEFKKEERGAVDLVTIVILIGIVIIIAVIFKNRITVLINSLFDTIDKGAQNAIKE